MWDYLRVLKKKGEREALRAKGMRQIKLVLMTGNQICGMHQRVTPEGSRNMEIMFNDQVQMQMEIKQYTPNDSIWVYIVRCFQMKKKNEMSVS